MIILASKPYTPAEIEQLKEIFEVYIKTVIDIDRKICVAGMDRHFEGEQMLLKKESSQRNIWGGGIDFTTKVIDFNSFINIRPNDNNLSSEIQSPDLRNTFEELMKYFFQEIL